MCRGRGRCMVSGRGRIWFRCRCSFTDGVWLVLGTGEGAL